jgi:hypothetical protein
VGREAVKRVIRIVVTTMKKGIRLLREGFFNLMGIDSTYEGGIQLE